jgi:UPF0716 family protein affecting phage T7 exclusion
MIIPGIYTDVVGLVILAIIFIWQRSRRKKALA